jgi:pilus assembly protein Flp/PilA
MKSVAFHFRMPRLMAQEDGATAIEYALLAGMIALAIILAVSAVGASLVPIFTDVNAGIPN